MKVAYETKIKELTEEQRRHLAWRLEHKGYCGNITAVRIARGEYRFKSTAVRNARGKWILKSMLSSEMTLLQVFMEFDFSEHSAKIHSRKVIDFKSKKGKTRCEK